MIWIVRLVGLLALGFGCLGLFFVWVAQGQQYAMPTWGELEWTPAARRGADWATYGAVALGGLLLLLNQGTARVLLALALAAALAKTGYDLSAGDPETSRDQVLVRGDLIAASASALAFLVSLFTRR